MILTSYFGNMGNLPDAKQKVSIARQTPKGLTGIGLGSELFPPSDLLLNYKEGSVSTWEYEKAYREQVLDKLDAGQTYNKYNNSVLLCYETPNDFCHRQIVSDWLKAHGYSVEEVRSSINIAVIGSRGFDDYATFSRLMDRLLENYIHESVKLVSGGAKSGADQMAARYAKEKGYRLDEYLPDWEKHGNGAGFVRHELIWSNADIGIAFWDGTSKGTAHSFEIAKRQHKKLYVVHYNDNYRIDLLDNTPSSVKHALL